MIICTSVSLCSNGIFFFFCNKHHTKQERFLECLKRRQSWSSKRAEQLGTPVCSWLHSSNRTCLLLTERFGKKYPCSASLGAGTVRGAWVGFVCSSFSRLGFQAEKGKRKPGVLGPGCALPLTKLDSDSEVMLWSCFLPRCPHAML